MSPIPFCLHGSLIEWNDFIVDNNNCITKKWNLYNEKKLPSYRILQDIKTNCPGNFTDCQIFHFPQSIPEILRLIKFLLPLFYFPADFARGRTEWTISKRMCSIAIKRARKTAPRENGFTRTRSRDQQKERHLLRCNYGAAASRGQFSFHVIMLF